MATIVLIATIAAVTAGEPAQTTPAPTPTVQQRRVEALLKQLDSNSRAEREQAEADLLQLGSDILPFLPPPELLPSAAVREAVRRTRIHLEREKARESLLPRRVTLQGRLTLSETLAEITKQTGNPIEVTPVTDNAERVEWDLRNVPFWEAIEAIKEKFELQRTIPTTVEQGTPSVPGHSPEPDPRLSAIDGPFHITARPASIKPIFGDDTSVLLRVPLSLSVEPRLRPLFLKFTPAQFTLSAKQQALGAPLNPEASYEIPVAEGGGPINLRADFKIAGAAVPTAVDLHGRLQIQIAAGTEAIRFIDVPKAAGVARRRGGVTVMVQQADFHKQADGTHSLKIRVAVSYDTGGPAFESHRSWILHNQVYLKSAAERVELNGGYSTSLQTDGAVVIEYRFEKLRRSPNEYEFVYLAPTLIIEVPVEFKFSDLPLLKAPQERPPE